MVPVGNVVKDYYIGHVHVRICDDYCRDKTEEEIDAILKRIARNAYGPLVAAMEKQAELATAEGGSKKPTVSSDEQDQPKCG